MSATEEAARALVAVDRAVRHARAEHAPYRVPADVAFELGWEVCPHCGRGIAAGAEVKYRGDLLHAECAVAELAEWVAA